MTYAILFVVHDDFLQGDDGAGFPRSGSVNLTIVEGPVLDSIGWISDAKARHGEAIPKCSLAQLALQLIVGDARAAQEAGSRSQVVEGKGSRRGAVWRRICRSFHVVGMVMRRVLGIGIGEVLERLVGR